MTYPHPYKYQWTASQPVNPTVPSKSAMRGEAAGKNKMKTSQKLLVDAHLRHSIRKLQDIGIEDLSGYDQYQIVSVLKPAEPSLVPPGAEG